MSLDLQSQINSIAKDLQSLSTQALQDEAARKRLLGVAMHATAILESPVETIWKLMMSPHVPSALTTLIKMGIVTEIVKASGARTATQLAESTGASRLLIIRLLRPVVALGIFKETDVETYISTPTSEMLATPALNGGFQLMSIITTIPLAYMPSYLESTGYKHVDEQPSPFQAATKTELSFFDWIKTQPALVNQFNTFMSDSRAARKNWYDLYPVNDILLDGTKKDDPDAVLLIDIGGGEGHDTQAFHAKFPKAPGKLILQDLGHNIDNIKALDPAVIRQKYDFFTPQPVKGARAYYLRAILHDWSDSKTVEILQNTASAMAKGYSKLLIFEWVLPSKGVPLFPSLQDINMMVVNNGMERTEEQWKSLLDRAGLKVVKVWKVSEEVEGLIEAELK